MFAVLKHVLRYTLNNIVVVHKTRKVTEAALYWKSETHCLLFMLISKIPEIYKISNI